MGLNLITLYRKYCVFCKIWFKCTNRIQQALQLFFIIIDLFHPSFIHKNWPVCNAFLDLFSNLLLSLTFFQNCDYLLINMQNHRKNYERAGREDAKKKKSYLIAKNKQIW